MTVFKIHAIIMYMKKTICSLFLILSAVFLFAERPLVHDIQAKAGKGTKVKVTWKLPENPEPEITFLVIYRTNEQISSYSQLSHVEPLVTLSPDTETYTDTLSDLKDYYYTVISMTDQLYDVVLLSFNSTVTGVHLTAKQIDDNDKPKVEYETVYPEGTLRKTPLPYLDMIEGINTEPLISDSVADTTQTLTPVKTADKKEKLNPYLFEEDLVSPDGGDAYLLFEILKSSFVTKKYKETIEKLNQLIGTNISEETRNRACFYLGESHYFNQDYEEAVRSFVKVQMAYPTLSKRWIEASLDRI